MTMADRFCGRAMRCFLAEDAGQDLVEYALIAGLMALGAIAGLNSVATNVAAVFTGVGTTLTSAL